MEARRSLLELVYPSGAPGRVCALGTGCPADLVPASTSDEAADLVVLAPGGDATSARGVETMVREALARLQPGGVVAAVGFAHTRRSLARLLEAAGLRRRLTLVHVPRGETTMLVSVEGGALRVAAAAGEGRRARAMASPALGSLPRWFALATHVFSFADADVAGWLAAPGVPPLEGLVLRPSWRGAGGSAIATGTVGDRAVVVGKVGLDDDTADVGRLEAGAIRELGPSARAAGARVPEVLGVVDLGRRAAAVLSVLEGAPVAARVRGRGSAIEVADRLAEWLERWGAATTVVSLPAGAIADEVLAPLAALQSELGQEPIERVRRLASEVAGREAPLTARHGDLTLWNVLDGRGALGIVDWEGAAARAFPLTDVPYLLVDAVAAERADGDRAGAYAACFSPGGSRAAWAAEITRRAAARLGVSDAVLELASHACWLGHAADERRREIVDGPFARVLRAHAGEYR